MRNEVSLKKFCIAFPKAMLCVSRHCPTTKEFLKVSFWIKRYVAIANENYLIIFTIYIMFLRNICRLTLFAFAKNVLQSNRQATLYLLTHNLTFPKVNKTFLEKLRFS